MVLHGCSSMMFQVHGIKYTHVCGKVIGYQDKSTDAFSTRERHIDGTYIAMMVSALLMGIIQESIFGPSLLPTLKVAHQTVEENVPAQIIKSHHHC